MKNGFVILLIVIVTTILAGCSSKEESTTPVTQKITAQEAKEMIDNNSDIIILDVRTKEEYNSGHIEDAILIPDYEIVENAEIILTDKSTKILVYCRSGNRSASATSALAELGYTSVYDFGGIIDWPFEVVTEQ
ncbi:MAG: Rhodanese domain protein [Anaerocolumna sp.]|jgi:rhodanese-related sulfurtransferase|nr:Rhodanese domain protein [Anaerocolumna sp.]